MSTKGVQKKAKRNNRSFNTYNSLVQKSRHPTRGMTKSARVFYDNLASSIIATLTAEALRCMKSRKTKTLQARDVSLAGSLALPAPIWDVLTNGRK